MPKTALLSVFAALLLGIATASPVSPIGETAAFAQNSGVRLLASGSFRGDRSHRASGTARLVRLSGGRHVIQLRGFRVTGGPDLRVWVTDASNVRNGRAARRANHVDLGALQSSRGDQNYILPAGALDGNSRSVVIWCRAFGVFFASAPLA